MNDKVKPKECKYYDRGACIRYIEDYTWKCKNIFDKNAKVPCPDFTPKNKEK